MKTKPVLVEMTDAYNEADSHVTLVAPDGEKAHLKFGRPVRMQPVVTRRQIKNKMTKILLDKKIPISECVDQMCKLLGVK